MPPLVDVADVSANLNRLRDMITAGQTAHLQLSATAQGGGTAAAWHGVLELTRIWGILLQSLSGPSVSDAICAAAGAELRERMHAEGKDGPDQPRDPAAAAGSPSDSCLEPHGASILVEAYQFDVMRTSTVAQSGSRRTERPIAQARCLGTAAYSAAEGSGAPSAGAAAPRFLRMLPASGDTDGDDTQALADKKPTASNAILCPKCHKRRAAQVGPFAAPKISAAPGNHLGCDEARGQPRSTSAQPMPEQHVPALMLSDDLSQRASSNSEPQQQSSGQAPTAWSAASQAESKSRASVADVASPALPSGVTLQSPLSELSASDAAHGARVKDATAAQCVACRP